MKTQEEIKLMGEKYAITHEDVSDRLGKYLVSACFRDGYTQCQEDNKDKKYTEEDMKKCWNTAFIDAMNMDSETYEPIFYSDFINSLNKQD